MNIENYIVRRARAADSQRIWEIRNHPSVRADSDLQAEIPLANHIDWFERKYFGNDDNYCFVLETPDAVVGYCRFDLQADGNYLSSIAIDPAFWGKGLANKLLGESLRQINQPSRLILAKIHKANIVSIKLFSRNGFKQISEDEGNLYFAKSF